MKGIKRVVSLILGLSMVVSCMTGCGGKDTESADGKQDVEISYWNSGLGTDWLDNMIAAFEEEHPEYNVYYTAVASSTAVTSSFGLEGTDTIDLYLGLKQYDTTYMEPLDAVLDSTAEGDNKTIREKFDAEYLTLETATDGKIYNLTYGGGILGIMYSKTIFDEVGITTLPRTTDELATVCDKLYEADKVALCHYRPSGYWDFMSEAWFAQYDGLDYYFNNFYACKDEAGNSPSKEVFTKKDGRYEVVKAYEQFIDSKYVLQGSNSTQHVMVQTEFLNGACAMMVNGSWIANEMGESGSTENFAMMKTPVLSAITDKLTTVKSDMLLRQVISAVDSVDSGEKKMEDYVSGDGYEVDGNVVSKEDWDYIATARNIMPINYSGESCFIPNYSVAKDGAKEFLKFLYSDKGYQIYTDTLHMGMPLSLCEGTVDTSDWSAFEQQQLSMFQSAGNYVSKEIASKHAIFTDGGADSFAHFSFISKYCTENKADQLDAEGVWDGILGNIEKNYESTWLKNIK